MIRVLVTSSSGFMSIAVAMTIPFHRHAGTMASITETISVLFQVDNEYVCMTRVCQKDDSLLQNIKAYLCFLIQIST